MTLIVCLDEKNGILFNHRRQSSDRKLRERVLAHAGSKTLWMSVYSAGQFPALPPNVRVDDDFLHRAEADDYCFLEGSCTDVSKAVDRLIVYRWNRKYPADVYFSMTLFAEFRLVGCEDFAGSSHERITEEVYEKD